jgi:hypothetical protein
MLVAESVEYDLNGHVRQPGDPLRLILERQAADSRMPEFRLAHDCRR